MEFTHKMRALVEKFNKEYYFIILLLCHRHYQDPSLTVKLTTFLLSTVMHIRYGNLMSTGYYYDQHVYLCVSL